MGFNSVYKALQDVFPQVDSRLLRAVAIEHPKDADAAVEVVLVEVIPYISKQSVTASPNQNSSLLSPSVGFTTSQAETSIRIEKVDAIPYLSTQSNEASSSNSNGSLPSPLEAFNDDTNDISEENVIVVEVPLERSPNRSSFHDENADPFYAHNVDREPLLSEKCGHNSKTSDDVNSSASVCEHSSNDNHDQGCGRGEQITLLDESEVSSSGDSSNNQKRVELEALEQVLMSVVPGNGIQLDAFPETPLTVAEELDSSDCSKSMSGKDTFAVETVNPEDECTVNSVITQSGQVCSIELLEDIIEDARNSKKTLVSAMDSVLCFMREVESKEKAAEQAKEEATRGCCDILAKVDELKQALRHAKEANDMHAGEVYAEKSILATEMKELQHRLLNLSEERDRSLGILEEMRKGLEMRLNAASKELEAAEQEKLEKGLSAREALAYQESQMEKVVEESKRLKQEAEENSKLQEFLIDRGCVVDMLQGEISVKCQDVMRLKEKFDKRIPLSQSLSSSTASSMLASSGSSLRSVTLPSEPECEMVDSSKNPEDSAGLINSYGLLEKISALEPAHSPDSPIVESVPTIYSASTIEKQYRERKVLLDDGWELFDDFSSDA